MKRRVPRFALTNRADEGESRPVETADRRMRGRWSRHETRRSMEGIPIPCWYGAGLRSAVVPRHRSTGTSGRACGVLAYLLLASVVRRSTPFRPSVPARRPDDNLVRVVCDAGAARFRPSRRHTSAAWYSWALTAAAIVPVGVATAIAFIQRVRGNSEEAPVAAIIAGYDFISLLIFALLVGTALALRRRSDVHKRLMTIASLSLLGPALARVVSDELAVWLTDVLVLMPITIDTWRHRRLHPAFGWTGALVLISTRGGVHIAASSQWIDFALRTFS